MSSSSSSSLSSLLDSNASSILGASTLNRRKAGRSVRGRPLVGSEFALEDDSQEGSADGSHDPHLHLLQKRLYPNPESTAGDTEEAPWHRQQEAKTELELAVLSDCLSSNPLLAHLIPNEIRRLCDGFEKCRYRDHEIIFKQGDPAQYVYVLYLGEVARQVDGREQPLEPDGKYTVLGELAVLTGSPHEETVRAASPCTLFRLGRVPFHRALRPSQETSSEERLQLLKASIPEGMVEYFSEATLRKLVSDMSTHLFQAGDVLVDRKTRLESLVIIEKGLVTATEVSLGGRLYDDQSFGPGEAKASFGWQSILTGGDEPAFKGKMVARSDGTALMLTQKAFRNALGGDRASTLQHLAAQRLARTQLQQIPIFQDSCLDEIQISSLLDLMHRFEYSSSSREEGKRVTIFKAGDKVEAAMYFVREGLVTLELDKGRTQKTVEAGGYFGESSMLRDQNCDGQKHFVIRSPMTATAHPHTTVEVLYLEECRTVVNTTLLGLGRPAAVSPIDSSFRWTDLDRHTLLGAGKFGQVWLASTPPPEQDELDGLPSEEGKMTNSEPRRRIVALKVQAKHQLVQFEKAERFVAERNILASLHSPFILRLFGAFQDESRLYMITSLLQGGELESIIPEDGLSESAAKFYAAGILEGLAHMHRRHVIHRDLKPTNILINGKGYPVLIDFGFAKYVPDKTYTFCGSPMFTAPEIIRYKGHDRGCDNWAWAVLVYRLVTGRYPFYEKGIDELTLYKRICKGTFELDGLMSIEFRMLMVAILYPDPAQRLGSRVNGWRDIFDSPWFANDQSFDLRRLRRQDIPAPWVPGLKDPLDASRFHPDASEAEDLMSEIFPMISDEQQQVFSSFGPQISSPF